MPLLKVSVWLFAAGVLVTSASAQPTGAVFTVTVRNEAKQPIVHANVLVTDLEGRFVVERSTDMDGVAFLAVPTGSFRVTASRMHPVGINDRMDDAIYPAQSSEQTTANGDVRVTLVLKAEPRPIEVPPADPSSIIVFPKSAVSGRVVTSQGAPVPRASVMVRPGFVHAKTEADGTFRLDVSLVEDGPFMLTAHAPSQSFDPIPASAFLPAPTTSVSVGLLAPNLEMADVEIVVPAEPAFRMTVRIADASGAVLPSTELHYFGENVHGSKTVPATGIVEIGPLRLGTYRLVAVGTGRTSQRYPANPALSFTHYPPGPRLAGTATVEITDGPRDNVELLLSPGARVRGRAEVAGHAAFPALSKPLHLITLLPGGIALTYSDSDPNGQIRNDGTFVLEGLVGERCLATSTYLEGWRASITHNGIDIMNRPMRFEPGAELDVRVRFEPGIDDTSSQPRCVR